MMPVPNDIKSTLDWLIKIDEYVQARELALTAARFLPADHPETSDFLAMILHRTKNYAEAVVYAQKTVTLLPDHIEARYNLARCLNSAGEAALAEAQIEPVIKARPDWLDPQLDLAMYICFQGRFDEAEQLLLSLQQKFPVNDVNQSLIKFNLAWHKLRHGQMKDGMEDLSIGRKIRLYGAESLNYPRPKLFKGLPVAGKKILLVGEAGAGDEMINVRFAKTIQDRGGQCLWVTNHHLEGLFSRVEGVQKVIQVSDVPQATYDYWAPAMDLFSLLNLDLKDLSAQPYLSPSSEYVKKWTAKMAGKNKFKVGFRWQGNARYEQDLYRSVPFQLFRRFFTVPGIDFYSLQRDTGLEELLPSDPVIELSSELVTWEDTAAAISLLDVVITSCTSIAHLAGAMGKKTFLFTPMVSYHVWALPGTTSPWYADVQLFRQKQFHDWSLEAEDILQELKRILQ
jgi:hypothetical protein